MKYKYFKCWCGKRFRTPIEKCIRISLSSKGKRYNYYNSPDVFCKKCLELIKSIGYKKYFDTHQKTIDK